MIETINELGLTKKDDSQFVILRKIRGKVINRPRGSTNISISANGRKDWIGWVELKTEPGDEIAMLNTGRVIRDLNIDILAVVEAEDRITLKTFSEAMVKKFDGQVFLM